MKAKLMALTLAAGLGITGIAITAQAAVANTTSDCNHETLHYYEYFLSASFSNPQYHMSTYRTGYRCDCWHVNYENKEYRAELHDYEQIYYRDGRVQSICTGCGDSYFW